MRVSFGLLVQERRDVGGAVRGGLAGHGASGRSRTAWTISALRLAIADVPIRAVNGDLWPTKTERNRELMPDFEAVVMAGAGHYPMLERPEEFNRLLVEIVKNLRPKTA